jgi:hypothetical protein
MTDQVPGQELGKLDPEPRCLWPPQIGSAQVLNLESISSPVTCWPSEEDRVGHQLRASCCPHSHRWNVPGAT